MVSISYCVTVSNEGAIYLDPLLKKLISHLTVDDEIVVVDDFSTEESTIATLEKYSGSINLYQHEFQGDFSAHKNFAKSKCTKQYIFFIDADENVNDTLLLTLKEILYNNNTVDMFLVPRVNVVVGITPEHIAKWGWRVNEAGHINYPDYQTRIIVNSPAIEWKNAVHEQLFGHETHAALPYETLDYCLLHIKNIDRQEKQNALYSTIK